MEATIETKYTTIEFHSEDCNGAMHFWSNVGLSHKSRDNPRAVAFGTLMDERILSLTREKLALAVHDKETDIYFEENNLVVHLTVETKHLSAKLIGIIELVEAEFDSLIKG